MEEVVVEYYKDLYTTSQPTEFLEMIQKNKSYVKWGRLFVESFDYIFFLQLWYKLNILPKV